MPLPSLYDLADNYQNVMGLLYDETVPDDVVNEALSVVEKDFNKKVVNVAAMGSFFEDQAEIAAKHEKEWADRKKRHIKAKKRIEEYLKLNMEAVGKPKVICDGITVSLRNNPPAVNITDETKIPARFVEIVQTPKIDKTAIKQALKLGEQVPGAELVQGKSVSIK